MKKGLVITVIILWAFLSFAKYYDFFLTPCDTQPRLSDWGIMICGPIIIVLEIISLVKANKQQKEL